MLRVVQGDLIKHFKEYEFDVIAHGCNCFCTMGAGIALTIKNEWPGVYDLDCSTGRGNRDKLGSISWYKAGNQFIVNCYTQYRYGYDVPHADYNAIRQCCRKLNQAFSGKRLGLPKIGCGLAGGDWEVVKQIMLEEFTSIDVTVMWL